MLTAMPLRRYLADRFGSQQKALSDDSVRGPNRIVLSSREIDGCGFPFIRKPFSQNDLKQTTARNAGLC
jgi:hypothetical protein